MHNRAISGDFLRDLKSGLLQAVTARVREDDTLMLALRGAYIDIYYRGGRIMGLKPKGTCYSATFDWEYFAGETELPELPSVIETEANVVRWLNALPRLKERMNWYFSRVRRKHEREFQQVVAWENNRSNISNETEYFVTDIEYDSGRNCGQVDLVGFKWLAQNRRTGKCTPALFEMKFGNNALQGVSGVKKHLDNFAELLDGHEGCERLNRSIEQQFHQLEQLGLVRFKRSASYGSIDVSGRPEVVLLLANINPRSSVLRSVLDGIRNPRSSNIAISLTCDFSCRISRGMGCIAFACSTSMGCESVCKVDADWCHGNVCDNVQQCSVGSLAASSGQAHGPLSCPKMTSGWWLYEWWIPRAAALGNVLLVPEFVAKLQPGSRNPTQGVNNSGPATYIARAAQAARASTGKRTKSMGIGTAIQKGRVVYVKDERGRHLWQHQVGTRAAGRARGLHGDDGEHPQRQPHPHQGRPRPPGRHDARLSPAKQLGMTRQEGGTNERFGTPCLGNGEISALL